MKKHNFILTQPDNLHEGIETKQNKQNQFLLRKMFRNEDSLFTFYFWNQVVGQIDFFSMFETMHLKFIPHQNVLVQNLEDTDKS